MSRFSVLRGQELPPGQEMPPGKNPKQKQNPDPSRPGLRRVNLRFGGCQNDGNKVVPFGLTLFNYLAQFLRNG